jgi:uncharacterized protein YukE
MSGQFLQGTTESMHHLGNQVRANIEQMTSTKQAMNGHVEAMSAQWMGAGSNANQQGHGMWDQSTMARVLRPGTEVGDNITTSANIYDQTDTSVQGRMAGVGAAINPVATA